jgi:ABC-type transporter Mla MlaB component
MAPSAPRTIAFAVTGPIARRDLPGLSARISALLEGTDAAVAVCEVTGIEPDVVAVDALARLQLAARRHGCEVRLRHASDELRELIALIGLDDVLVEA